MPDVLFCSQCGTQNAAGAVFCQRCGAGLQPRAVTTTGSAPPAVTYAESSAPYGGFWIRFVAIVIDGIIIGIVTIPIVAVLAALGVLHHPTIIHHQLDENDMGAIVALSLAARIVWAAMGWLYEALLTSSTWQATVGKKALNLKVVDEAGNRISLRGQRVGISPNTCRPSCLSASLW